MACHNCYNGCTQIISDKCVKYTGVDVPILGIENGDSLSYVEQALITFLTTTLDGSGIKININEELYCELVSQYLQECSTVTALDLFKALVQAACNLQTQIDAVESNIATIEANYTVDCLEGVATGDGTHDIVQAVINKLCEIDEELAALALDLETNYVKISEIDTYIEEYLAAHPTEEDKARNKMVPYTVVEYYGSLSNYPETGDSFDISGAGQNYWEDIYLCNGQNGTPDKRGRSPIGAIAGMGGGSLDSEVNPGSSPFNKNYSISGVNSKNGINSIILDETQIPAHDHAAVSTSTITPNPHSHTIGLTETDTGITIAVGGESATATQTTSSVNLSVSTSTVISDAGGGLAHSNVHPVLACYYIMYRPS